MKMFLFGNGCALRGDIF